MLPKVLGALGQLLLHAPVFVPMRGLLEDATFEVPGELGHRLRLQGLQEEIVDPELDAALGVFEFLVGGYYHYLGERISFVDAPRQFEAVHIGHGDVDEDHVRLRRLHQVERLEAVRRLADEFVADGKPIDE